MQVQGVVQDRNGRTVATLFGKWDESMHYINGDGSGKGKSEPQLLWKQSKPPKYQTRYNFTRFAITLNELTPGLKVMLLIPFALSHFVSFLPIPFKGFHLLLLILDIVNRRNCHQQILDSDQTKDAWKMVNMKWPIQRSCD